MSDPTALSNAAILAALPAGFSRLTSDSRAVRTGDVFVAYPGTTGDGRDHIDSAVMHGAVAVLVEARGYVVRHHGVPCVTVENLRRRYATLADIAAGTPSAKLSLVGVTGTNGKTTVTTWIAQALESIGVGCGVIGTLGAGRLGALRETTNTTPDAANIVGTLTQLVNGGARAAAMEVSSHALHQRRVDGLQFRVAVFTNLTRDHLDYHGSLEAYAEAKAHLFEFPSLTHIVLNADDPAAALMRVRMPSHAQCLTFGVTNPNADVRLVQASLTSTGMQLDIATPWGVLHVAPRVLGEFNVSNMLTVVATLSALGHTQIPELTKMIDALAPVRGRMELIAMPPTTQGPRVIVDYAHTPDALEKALNTVRGLSANGRLIVVFGCGGNRDAGKRPLMGAIAQRLADQVWVTSDNPRDEDAEAIIANVLRDCSATPEIHAVTDRAQAIHQAISRATANDIILIAGKGHETTQEIAGVKTAFDDATVAREALCLR